MRIEGRALCYVQELKSASSRFSEHKPISPPRTEGDKEPVTMMMNPKRYLERYDWGEGVDISKHNFHSVLMKRFIFCYDIFNLRAISSTFTVSFTGGKTRLARNKESSYNRRRLSRAMFCPDYGFSPYPLLTKQGFCRPAACYGLKSSAIWF